MFREKEFGEKGSRKKDFEERESRERVQRKGFCETRLREREF